SQSSMCSARGRSRCPANGSAMPTDFSAASVSSLWSIWRAAVLSRQSGTCRPPTVPYHLRLSTVTFSAPGVPPGTVRPFSFPPVVCFLNSSAMITLPFLRPSALCGRDMQVKQLSQGVEGLLAQPALAVHEPAHEAFGDAQFLADAVAGQSGIIHGSAN